MWHRLELQNPTETIAVLELTSIARGYLVADSMIKYAPVQLVEARPYYPGKFLIVVSGDVASVRGAAEVGVAQAGPFLFASLCIPNLAPPVVYAVNRVHQPPMKDTIGVLESFSAVALIEAVDHAWKSADVDVHSMELLQGIGGKAFAIFTGELTNVETAMADAQSHMAADLFVAGNVVSSVSPEILPFLPGST